MARFLTALLLAFGLTLGTGVALGDTGDFISSHNEGQYMVQSFYIVDEDPPAAASFTSDYFDLRTGSGLADKISLSLILSTGCTSTNWSIILLPVYDSVNSYEIDGPLQYASSFSRTWEIGVTGANRLSPPTIEGIAISAGSGANACTLLRVIMKLYYRKDIN